MDYEKKYNEALKWMRELYPGLHGATKEDAEHFFPELRESEDERVRKAILAAIRQGLDTEKALAKYNVTYDDVEAWLEKQKEQKPVEWSEEDKEMLMRCIAAIPVQGDEIMPTSYLNKLRNWLEFLPERFNPPPKQEWSETDEKMLTGIIERGSVQVPPYTTALREEQIEWLMNRLKSLRPQPHWKPSEEQIEALKFAVKLYKDTHFENNHEKIVSLYEQLKKLM